VAAPAVRPATTRNGLSSAAAAGLLLLLGSAVLALVFASIPAPALGSISPGLVERRADIGLGLALMLAVGGGVFVILVGT
jgi:hypothetical protein